MSRILPGFDGKLYSEHDDPLPCPFCGAEVRVISWIGDSRHVVKHPVTDTDRLSNDGRFGPLRCPLEGKGSVKYPTKGLAIEAWNTRVERTCKFVSSRGVDYPPVCSECGYELGIYDCEWLDGGAYHYDGNYCPHCGAKVVE